MKKVAETIKKFVEVDKWLPVALSDGEIVERAKTMSQRHKEKEELEADKARVMRDFGERLKNISGEVSRLSQIVSTGEEFRNVACRLFKSLVDKTLTITRCDTGELIEKRPLSEGELQVEMELGSTKSSFAGEDLF